MMIDSLKFDVDISENQVKNIINSEAHNNNLRLNLIYEARTYTHTQHMINGLREKC